MYYNYIVAFAEREVDMGHEIPSRAHLTQNEKLRFAAGTSGGFFRRPNTRLALSTLFIHKRKDRYCTYIFKRLGGWNLYIYDLHALIGGRCLTNQNIRATKHDSFANYFRVSRHLPQLWLRNI